ncbi:MAG: uroporphyrinogen decarboxylase [Pseudomonadota bacterium]
MSNQCDGSGSKFLSVLAGNRVDPPPIWMMRQAGRYLDEYRATRAQAGDFLSLCYSPELAAEVTLQPIRRFGFDAAILFSDILVIPHALGQGLRFAQGEGPRLPPIDDLSGLATLKPDQAMDHLAPVFSTVRHICSGLKAEGFENTPLIGFCGAPWTVATYMVEGQGSKDQGHTRARAYASDGFFEALIDMLVDVSAAYLIEQVNAGTKALQIFDSWAGSLSPEQFDRWVITPTREMVRRIRAVHPDVPIIGFPRGAGWTLAKFVEETGVNAVSIDTSVPPHVVDGLLPKSVAVQGNLDPMLLIAGGDALNRAVDAVCEAFQDRPHIFNLGHGITPTAPVDHVHQMINRLRARG